MNEITMYEAYDGTTFRIYEDCLQHEKELLAKENFMGQVTVFNSVGQGSVIKAGLSLDEIRHKFCRCVFIRFESTEAANSFFDFMKEKEPGCCTWKLDKVIHGFIPKEIYRFNSDGNYWYNYTSTIEDSAKFEKKMREWSEPTIEERG